MVVPQTFPTPPSQSIATFNWTELASGTGFVKYFLSESETSAGNDYHLGEAVIYSKNVSRIKLGSGSTDDDFDLTEFQFPQTIKGIATINVFYAIAGKAAGGSLYLTLKLRKWDGSDVIEIVSVQTDTETAPADTPRSGVFTVPMTIPQTHFKRGETLRLTVQMTLTGTNPDAAYGHDPKNRAGTPVLNAPLLASDSNIHIPYMVVDI